MRIDLHTHSTVSDGTDTPTELMTKAAEVGLDVIALTDHDTSAGWAEAEKALADGMTLVRGAELSCESPDGTGGHHTVHLLAYLFDPESPALVREQLRLREERRQRLRRMANLMAADGFPVDPDEIMADVPEDGAAGRPHLARALVRAGRATSVTDAFEKYLAAGKPYYISRTDTPIERAIDMIAEAGGETVLAHPFSRMRRQHVTADVIRDLARRGLSGVEVNHPEHDEAARAQLARLAAELGLVATGSSDYHGTNKTVRLGQETTDPEQLDALVARTTGVPLVSR